MDPTTAARLIAIARSQIGTTEQPPGSNHNPYATEVAPRTQGYAWCGVFVSWCFDRAGIPLPLVQPDYVPGGGFSYCPSAVNWARNTGQAVYDRRTGAGWAAIQPGDVVLFDWESDGIADHTGIVVSVDPDGALRTIEGNTASDDHGDQSNGGGVYRKRRLRPSVACVWRPPVPETKTTGTIEEDDEMIQFPVRPLADGRWVKVRAAEGGRLLSCILGRWAGDFPAGSITDVWGTQIIDVAKALGKPSLVGDVKVGQSGAFIIVSDSDGDYAFEVAA